jgi:hypothetical protein
MTYYKLSIVYTHKGNYTTNYFIFDRVISKEDVVKAIKSLSFSFNELPAPIFHTYSDGSVVVDYNYTDYFIGITEYIMGTII